MELGMLLFWVGREYSQNSLSWLPFPQKKLCGISFQNTFPLIIPHPKSTMHQIFWYNYIKKKRGKKKKKERSSHFLLFSASYISVNVGHFNLVCGFCSPFGIHPNLIQLLGHTKEGHFHMLGIIPFIIMTYQL